jgi:hypothetical protein
MVMLTMLNYREIYGIIAGDDICIYIIFFSLGYQAVSSVLSLEA